MAASKFTPTDVHQQAISSFVELMVQKIESLEKSGWTKPWLDTYKGLPQNLSGVPYRGSNALLLLLDMSVKGYELPVYTTFEAARKMGFYPQKGSKSTRIFFWHYEYRHTTTDEKISPEEYKSLPKEEKSNYRSSSYIKFYHVFNLDQTNFKESHPDKWEALRQSVPEITFKGHAQMDAMIKMQNWLCPIRETASSHAYYDPGQDLIQVPSRSQFSSEESFYGTLLHEMVHSTGAKDRLNRDLSGSFGSESYAKEELVAELTAAILGQSIGISTAPTQESAQYLKSWLEQSDRSTKFLFELLNDVGRAHNMSIDRIQKQEVELSKPSTLSSQRSDLAHQPKSPSLTEEKDPTAIYLREMQHNELICAAILTTDGDLIRHLSLPSEALQEIAVKQNPHSIRYIPEATGAVQLLACKLDGSSIQHIPFPTEQMKLTAVKQCPSSIAFLKEPSLSVQLAAVKKDAAVISLINEPCKAVQDFLEKSGTPRSTVKSSSLSEEIIHL